MKLNELFETMVGNSTASCNNWTMSFFVAYCFLTNRRQRVILNGTCSEWANVLSGVPQATVLGPLLFLIYINDICVGIDSSIKLFADDCVLYRSIRNIGDVASLQRDLDYLAHWGDKW